MSHTTLAVVSPSSPRAPVPLAAPVLLLDPLTALQLSDRGDSSSGHASSHSPSPRATQSPPKQTVFSPCVDIFEPGPSCWEDGDEEQEHRDEDEDDDMGADESQYRHRRLTGDSGIEVCRCRVEEEEDEEEEKEECRKGEESENIDVHDSVDCPARIHLGTGEELSQCTPTAAVTTTTPDDGGKVIVVMETV
uniref:WW domain binding protein 1 n=1 Tax=Nothobranchius rachovii TaxID=451742 RepID=A0A1A8PUH5_9TELE